MDHEQRKLAFVILGAIMAALLVNQVRITHASARASDHRITSEGRGGSSLPLGWGTNKGPGLPKASR
jgi:hypothetical protein